MDLAEIGITRTYIPLTKEFCESRIRSLFVDLHLPLWSYARAVQSPEFKLKAWMTDLRRQHPAVDDPSLPDS